ncbi:MAG: efflux RND transporter periplasmic adaptor subunit [Gemmatimonadota bacterium]
MTAQAGWTGRKTWVVWTVVALAAVVAIAVLYSRVRTTEVDVVAPAPREVVRTLVVTGRVRPPIRSEIGTGVAGVVDVVTVREGDAVGAGDLLLRLDDREARAGVAQAEARLAEVEAAVNDEVRRAELELEQARRDAERVRSVVLEGGLTQQRLEQAEQRAADAGSRLAAARAGVGSTGAIARVAETRAALEAARARLARHTIAAPYAGTVLSRWVEPGEAVQPGRGLLELAADGPTELVAFPAEENLARIAVGAPARVSADAYPDDVFEATVSLVAPSVDDAQGTVELRFSIDGSIAYLRPGMTVSVNLEVGRRRADQTVPVSAVRGLATEEPWVMLARDGRSEQRDVGLGVRGDAFVEVLEGLEPEDAVIRAADEVEPGDRVRPRSGG